MCTFNCISALFFREQDLTSDLAEFNIEIDDLMEDLDSYDVNITRADETIDLLSLQANRTQSSLQQLTSLVRLLERRVNVDLRMQLTDLLTLNEQLTRQVCNHIGAVIYYYIIILFIVSSVYLYVLLRTVVPNKLIACTYGVTRV